MVFVQMDTCRLFRVTWSKKLKKVAYSYIYREREVLRDARVKRWRCSSCNFNSALTFSTIAKSDSLSFLSVSLLLRLLSALSLFPRAFSRSYRFLLLLEGEWRTVRRSPRNFTKTVPPQPPTPSELREAIRADLRACAITDRRRGKVRQKI